MLLLLLLLLRHAGEGSGRCFSRILVFLLYSMPVLLMALLLLLLLLLPCSCSFPVSSPYRQTVTKKYVRRPTSQTATYTYVHDERLLSLLISLLRLLCLHRPCCCILPAGHSGLLLPFNCSAAVRSCRSLFDCAAAAHAAKLFVVWCAGFGNDHARLCAYSYGCTSAESPARNFSPARRTPHAESSVQ